MKSIIIMLLFFALISTGCVTVRLPDDYHSVRGFQIDETLKKCLVIGFEEPSSFQIDDYVTFQSIENDVKFADMIADAKMVKGIGYLNELDAVDMKPNFIVKSNYNPWGSTPDEINAYVGGDLAGISVLTLGIIPAVGSLHIENSYIIKQANSNDQKTVTIEWKSTGCFGWISLFLGMLPNYHFPYLHFGMASSNLSDYSRNKALMSLQQNIEEFGFSCE